MTFQQLTYLLEVHKTGSFSAAAKNLFLSQSAVSNAIISLEKEIGVTIFTRGAKYLTTTAQGEEVIRHAKRICESAEQLTGQKNEQKKSVRVCCASFDPASRAFIRLLEENSGITDIEFSIEDGRGGDALKRLNNRELDIALFINFSSYNPPTRMESIKEHEFDYQELATIPASVCIGEKHPLYNKTEVMMQELQYSRLLVASRSSLSSILPAYLPVKKSNTLIAQGYRARKMILDAGQAFTIQHMPGEIYRESTLRYIPIKGLNYIVYMVTNPKYPLCPEAIRYIELLKEEVKKAYP